MMAKVASKSPILLFLSLLTIGSSGALAGYSYNAREKIPDEKRMLEHEQIFHSPHRELVDNLRTYLRDAIAPPTTPLPTNPGTTAPVNVPPTPPSPIAVAPPAPPTNPGSTPVPIPPMNPASTVPPTNPASSAPPTNPASSAPPTNPATSVPPANPSVNQPAPITNPVTTPSPPAVPGSQPATNPVTTYPAPVGNTSVPPPVTNPATPSASTTTNAPAVPGQSWCVARNGAAQTALQAALDYACGIGGVDCSAIQEGQSCYNPNNLQNHASYAFNNYYQKNPVATSCDFGGTAVIANTNPSTGSCVFPTSASSSSTPSLPTPPSSTANPASSGNSAPPTTTSTQPPPTTGASGTIFPPLVANSSTPGSDSTTIFGPNGPPDANNPTSKSTSFQQFAVFLVQVGSTVAACIAVLYM